jgi:adenylyltransferase/sulfurtransferase
MKVTSLVGNLMADVGLGWFRWAQVVVGALDNREARVAVNSNCAQTGRPWIDGGIEVLNGIVRGFAPPETACYECTMGRADWDQLNKRRSCSLLARQAFAGGGTPTTPTTASVIGAIQSQEVVKRLHDLPALSGAGYVFEGLAHNSFQVAYTRNPDCPWHEAPPPIEAVSDFGGATRLADVWAYAEQRLNGLDALDLAREIVSSLHCPQCGADRDVFKPIDRITHAEAVCQQCSAECYPNLFHSMERDTEWLQMTARDVGLPAWDVIWARTGGEAIGIELGADAWTT